MEMAREISQINITKIVPNTYQPRIIFDEEGIRNLADSIKEHGIIQPLIVRQKGDLYEIIAGERRYQAAKLVGLPSVPAIITNATDGVSAELAMVENTQRKDLNPMEEAKGYERILSLGQTTQDQLAIRMGLSQPTIANRLRLLQLDPSVQNALLNSQISERHARSLLRLKDHAAQREMLSKITLERLTVKETENSIKNMIGEDTSPESDTSSGEQNKENMPINEVLSSVENINVTMPSNVNETVQSALSDLNVSNKESEIFNDNEVSVTEKEEATPENVDIDQIKNNAMDISSLFKNLNSVNTENNNEPINGKFFKSLEDEGTNMSFVAPSPVPDAKNVESVLPQYVEPAKAAEEAPAPSFDPLQVNTIPLIDSNVTNTESGHIKEETPESGPVVINGVPSQFPSYYPQSNTQEPVIEPKQEESVAAPAEIKQEETQSPVEAPSEVVGPQIIETTTPDPAAFNSESVFPSLVMHEEKPAKPEPSPSSIFRVKNAIGMTRNLVTSLEASGYKVESEELDLEEEYQIIIKFPKNQ